jgi:hypothetical protein
MIDVVMQHLGAFIAAFLAGGATGSLITLRIVKKKQVRAGSSVSDQRGARAGRDIVGGDSTSVRK